VKKAVMYLFLFCLMSSYAYSAEKEYADPVTGMEFVFVKGGCFHMGVTYGHKRIGEDKDERPVHEVCVGDFYMGKYEVTVEQFRKFVSNTGYKTDAEKNAGGYNGCWAYDADDSDKLWKPRDWANWKNPNKYQENQDRHPVSCVSWNDAKEFTKWLGSKNGKSYRLPTEAEWEYAARAGTETRNFWGNNKDDACKYANVADNTNLPKGRIWNDKHGCTDGYAFAAPVGEFKPNAFGFYDMMGNVWEWCENWFDKDNNQISPKNNQRVPETERRIEGRGGSWGSGPQGIRATRRDASGVPLVRSYDTGFRVVFGR
jgi:formylglycine-generating enzyme required for sulfatase activity